MAPLVITLSARITPLVISLSACIAPLVITVPARVAWSDRRRHAVPERAERVGRAAEALLG